jgi:hypothetical protein
VIGSGLLSRPMMYFASDYGDSSVSRNSVFVLSFSTVMMELLATCKDDYRRRLNWLIGFIAPYTFTQLGTRDNAALALVYILYSPPLHTHTHTHTYTPGDCQSSLVVSWRRIYYSLTVTAAHMKSSLHSLIRVPSPELYPILDNN